MVSGGSCRSASIVTTYAPRARARPAEIAAWCPALARSRTTRTASHSRRSRWRSTGVASVDPSSTQSTSRVTPHASATGRSRSTNRGRTSCSLYIGTTTLSSTGGAGMAPRVERVPLGHLCLAMIGL